MEQRLKKLIEMVKYRFNRSIRGETSTPRATTPPASGSPISKKAGRQGERLAIGAR